MAAANYEIHPAIGIARVGTAPDSFYIGPETAGGLPLPAEGAGGGFGASDFRDAEGRVRRQAARFRIYRSRPGEPAQEITLDSPEVKEIRWTAHLANKKASWYRFATSRGEHGYCPDHPLRNADRTTAEERQRLIIDPGPRAIAGRNAGGPAGRIAFSRDSIPASYRGGSFPPASLKPYAIDSLGELATDAAGRLLLLGGFGNSGTLADAPALTDYCNNDGWWDDVSDGPVRATVLLASGERIEAKSAWAVVAPPAYAPQIVNLVTLYDVILDTAVRHLGARPEICEAGIWKAGPNGYRPHFENEIRPIFERAALYPWVAPIPASPHVFDYAQLGDPGPASAELRKFYRDILRGPGQENVFDSPVSATGLMPLLVGDDALGAEQEAGAELATGKYLALTGTQRHFLRQWAEGYFETGPAAAPHPGQALTKAVLDNCTGGPFSPGIEMTWIARDPAIYAEPLRIRPRQATAGPLSLGFDPAAGLEPGDVTRYMALPWQADFNECAAQTVLGRVMWWWPAQRPVAVYSPAEGDELGPQRPWVGSERDSRAKDYYMYADHLDMLQSWDKLGFVLDTGTPAKPRFVEVSRLAPQPPAKNG